MKQTNIIKRWWLALDLLKNYIYKQVAGQNLSQAEAKQMLVELKEKANEKEDEIAIIGMSGIFPKAKNLEEYWNNIAKGAICIDELPKERVKDIEDFLLKFHYHQLKEENAIKENGELDITYQTRGYLDEIDKFDWDFFGIPPREAKAMDPDQRKFLEIAYKAMEDAGYGGNKIYGTKTGIFVGIDHVSDMKYKQLAALDPMVVTGTWPGILASRVSYIFNLLGPSIVIDTACSSGLVSVHAACNSIKNGECDMAIAGGLSSFYYRPMKFKDELKELDSVESKDNIVRTFDNNANGTVWGEGVGAVLLKPLSKALADGDPIHAVIKASAINNDGASNGITAPDAGAQEKLLKTAWDKAKINPETVEYIEAHGTGTVLGDPIEVKAMTNAFRRFTDKKQFCGIGSVKTSIGHLVGASGLASLLKVIMMLKNKAIPASLNFTEPNGFINFCDSPVYVSDELRAWEQGDSPRRAGVNSFGFSGTNCHVVLEEAPQLQKKEENNSNEFEILTVSAKKQHLLKETLEKYYKTFESQNLDLQDICYTANTGRGHYTHRIVFMVKDYEDLKEKIEYVLDTDFNDLNKFGVYYSKHKIVSDNKKTREKGEISERERRNLTKSAQSKFEELIKSYNYPTAAELCEFYVRGAKIEWDKLYQGQNRRTVNLPTYSLERLRCWYEEKSEDVKAKTREIKKMKEISHPLVDICLAESFYQDIYTTEFSVDTHWVLSDHKILGNYVIPGTTYIEMTLEICKKYYGCDVELRDIIYYTPAIVGETETRSVHSILTKHKDYIELTFASKANSGELDEQWVKHAECKVYKLSNKENKVYDIKDIMEKLLGQKDEEKLIDISVRGSGAQLGERWQNSKTIAVGKSEALIELELPEYIAYDLDKYYMHVSMLDNAVNAISQEIGEGLYLPLLYKSLKVSGKMPKKFYSYIRIKEESLRGMETITFNISMMDCEGKTFAEVSDYSIKKVNEAEFKARRNAAEGNFYFELGWINSEISGNKKDLTEGSILVFKDNKGIGDQIIEGLKLDNCNIVEVQQGVKFNKINENKYEITGEEADYQTLMKELADKELSQIVYLMTLTHGEEINSIEELEKQRNLSTLSLFNLTRALVSNKINQELDIVLVADYANEVTKEEKRLVPHNAALFGISKVIPLENPNLKCRCIDIDDSTGIEDIMKELKSEDKTFKVAYREGKRFVEEFRKLDLVKNLDGDIEVKEKGLYIITGGTGGLGLEMGNFIASKNKAKIVLVSRSVFPDKENWEKILNEGENKKICRAITAIRQIEEHGAEVICENANVSNIDEMRELVDKLRKSHGAIKGIIHCAGVAGDGFIIRKKKEDFEKVLAPKVQGTWILDDVTKDDNLDFFVMFSSILSIFGDPGQGDYTAANSYMDTFAAYRAKKGKKTFAINWPAWKETGMAVDYGIVDSETTIKPISTENALKSFEEIINSQVKRVLPGDLNYSKIIKLENELTFKLSSQIENVLKKQKIKLNMYNDGDVKEESGVQAVIKGKGGEAYNDTESRLAQIWANALGLDEIDIFDNFTSLGGDSLMAIQLLKQINEVFKGAIDISDIFSYPSVEQMATYIDEKMGTKEKAKKVKAKEEMSDDNLKKLLDGVESGDTSIENALKMLIS